MKNIGLGFIVLLSCLAFGPARAECADKDGTGIELTVTVHRSVMQDTLSAILYFREEAPDVDAVQQAINRKMQEAWPVASNVGGIDARIRSYRVWYDDGTRRNNRYGAEKPTSSSVAPKWIGNQVLELSSKDGAAMKQLVDQLQGLGFALSHFGYSVSPELYERTQDELLPAAAAKLLQQGQVIAAAFGSDILNIEEINLGGRSNQRAYAMESPGYNGSGRQAPVAEPVEQEIWLSLGGLARMKSIALK